MAWTAADITAVEDAIRAKMTGGAVQSYSLSFAAGGTRNVTHMTLSELRALRGEMRAEARSTEAAGNGMPSGFSAGIPIRHGISLEDAP